METVAASGLKAVGFTGFVAVEAWGGKAFSPGDSPLAIVSMARQVPATAAVGLVLILVFGGMVVGVPAFASDAVDAAEPSDPPEGPQVAITIEVDAMGDAHWEIAYRFGVDTTEQTQAFEDLSDAVQAGEVELPLSVATMEGYLADATAVVDRDMAIEDATWSERIEGDVGVLTLAFTWQDFAATSDGSLAIGDAFHGQEGLWIESLSEDMRLTIEGPEGYDLEGASDTATVDGTTVTWEGPTTFESASLDLTYSSGGRTPFSMSPDVIALVVLFVLIIGTVAIGYRRGWEIPTSGPTQPEATASTAESEPDIDVELLSDPERVEHLLADNGGRMKQAKIVEDTGWSSAKVSQLLSEMADEGRVEKLRIGQENLISLPDSDGDNAAGK